MVYLLAIVTDADFTLITVVVNGVSRELSAGVTLLDLANTLHLVPESVICEHNGTLCRVPLGSGASSQKYL